MTPTELTTRPQYQRTLDFLREGARYPYVPVRWAYQHADELLKDANGESHLDEIVALGGLILTELFDRQVLLGDCVRDCHSGNAYARTFQSWNGVAEDWIARAQHWISDHGRVPNDGELGWLHDPSVLAAKNHADIHPSFVNLLDDMDAFLEGAITAGEFTIRFCRSNSLVRTELEDGTSIGYDVYQEMFYAVDDFVEDPTLRTRLREEKLTSQHFGNVLDDDELLEAVGTARAKFSHELARHGYDAHGRRSKQSRPK